MPSCNRFFRHRRRQNVLCRNHDLEIVEGRFARGSAGRGPSLSAQLANSIDLAPGSATTFQLTNVLGTTGTLFGRQITGSVLNTVYIERGVNIAAIANNGSLPNAVDFASATNASAAVTDTITVNGISGETAVSTITSLVNTGCTAISLEWTTSGGATMPIVGYQVDSLKMLAGETNYFTAIAEGTDFTRTTSVLSRARTISMTLPDKITVTTLEELAGLYQRLRFVYTLPASLTFLTRPREPGGYISQRSNVAPTVKPAPTLARRTRSPFFSRFSSSAVCMARGMVPAVVLP